MPDVRSRVAPHLLAFAPAILLAGSQPTLIVLPHPPAVTDLALL
jgi:hypothetical protein